MLRHPLVTVKGAINFDESHLQVSCIFGSEVVDEYG